MISNSFQFAATGYLCLFALFCDGIGVTGTTSVGCLGFGLSLSFCDSHGLTHTISWTFSSSVETGPTVKRRDNICHMQTIKHKAPHTKLHALLPDFLESVLEFNFLLMSRDSGKQYWEGYSGKLEVSTHHQPIPVYHSRLGQQHWKSFLL